MTERSVLNSAQRVDATPPAAAPRRRFSGFIKAALDGWLAMADRWAVAAPYRFPPF